MPSFLHALYLLSIAHFVTAQSAAASSNPLAAESSYLASAQASDSAENSVLSAADASSYAAATSAASVAQSAASASEASGISAASVSEASEVSAAAAATSTYIDTAQSDLGILQLVTPTTHANQVAESALNKLEIDADSFYTAYTQVDPFNFESALILAVNSQPAHVQATFAAADPALIQLYYDGPNSLLDNPTSYLSRLHDSASIYPKPFSSSLLSQATGLLLGYESIVSEDILSKTPSASVTPGMSIAVGGATVTAASPGTSVTQASQGTTTAASTAASPSPSKAAGVPIMAANPVLMMNAAAGAIGVIVVAMM